METFLANAINSINSVLWNYILIILLLGVGTWFTLRFGFIQLRALPHSLKMLCKKSNGEGISPFQALTIGLASRVGTGNIAGVAIALTLAGPGAIFWMWMTAILGMASAFVEATLAQIFKVPHGDKTFRGGPAYYIQMGLGSRFFGILFALSLILAFAFVFNAVQANSIADAFHASFGWQHSNTGIVLAVLTALIVFGGIKRVANATKFIVPVMAMGYLGLAFYVVISHFSLVPHVFSMIISHAFGLQEVAGGFAGFAMKEAVAMGVKRGLFSNEAGMGSAPNAAATATTHHPVNQGLLQMLGVFIDTIVVCSATAFLILLSGQYEPGAALQGATLTQSAVASEVGPWGDIFMAFAIFFFAFSSVIGNYAYAEGNVEFITKRKSVLFIFRLMVLGMVMFGSVGSLPLVWSMADTSMGFMAIINLIAILLLGKYALAAWRQYNAQRAAGHSEPVFDSSVVPGIADKLAKGVWPTAPLPSNSYATDVLIEEEEEEKKAA